MSAAPIIMAALSYIAAGIAVAGAVAFDFGRDHPRPDRTEAELMAELRNRTLIAFALWPLVSILAGIIALWRLVGGIPAMITGLYRKGIEDREAAAWASQHERARDERTKAAAKTIAEIMGPRKAGPR